LSVVENQTHLKTETNLILPNYNFVYATDGMLHLLLIFSQRWWTELPLNYFACFS